MNPLPRSLAYAFAALLALPGVASADVEPRAPTSAELASYPWLREGASLRPLEAAVAAPDGFARASEPAGSFGAWLRRLPLRAAGEPVRSFDGRVLLEGSDPRLTAVATLDVPPRDLQQCADSVIRLHGEWLWASGRSSDARYPFTSGDVATFAAFAAGSRPVIDGKHVRFAPSARPDGSHGAFDRFLELVMQYAGTISLAAYSQKVARAELRAGDFFVLPGGPGHAVLVLDVAERGGARMALLGQGYMPAQDFHVLRAGGSAWFSLEGDGVATPFWSVPFPWSSARRLAP